MAWRKWLVRCLVSLVLASVCSAGWLYLHWTDPEAVRQHVVGQIESTLLNTTIRVDSAQLRLLGGVSLYEVRASRSDNPDAGDLLYVPEAVIYHDKEQLLQGKLAIRKVELHRPRIRVVRGRDGKWNVSKILGPPRLDEPVPTIVIEQGTILFEDRLGAPDLMPLELKNVNLTLVNDPLLTLDIVIRGAADLLGPLQMHLSLQRDSDALTATLETQGAVFGPAHVQRIAAYCPAAADHLRQLEGVARIQAAVDRPAGTDQPLSQRIRCQLTRGKVSHSQLPLPLEDLDARLRFDDGRFSVETLTARAGPTRFTFTGSIEAPRSDADLSGNLKVENLVLNPELFARLPEPMSEIQRDYSPTGPVDGSIEFSRQGGEWHRHFIVVSADAKASSIHFPYAIEHLAGTFEQEIDTAKSVNVKHFNFVGRAGTRPIHIHGDAHGNGSDADLTLTIWGENIELDDKLRAALSPKLRPLAESFHPVGQADFVAKFTKAPGPAKCANHIVVRFHDAALCYDVFPYPLEKVSGTLEILPDHWEFRDFRGTHNGGEFLTWGRSHPGPGGDRVAVTIRGTNLLMDNELKAALTPRGKPESKLQQVWATLHPGGRLNVSAVIDQLPQQAEDIDVNVTARGCTLRPDFFPYAMEEVGGTVHYARGRVDLSHFSAKHGKSTIGIEQGHVILKPAGGFYARMANLEGTPLFPDDDFRAALPPALRTVFRTLELKDPLTVNAREFIVDSPAEPNVPPVVYWDGGVRLNNAKLSVGVDLADVSGQFWCRARHNGREMEGLLGNLLLDQATLFKQPIRDVCCHLQIAREAPEVLKLPGLQAHLFGGDVGGEARVEFGPTLLYELNLTATQIKLEEFARHNFGSQTEFTGQAMARLHLEGRGAGVSGLQGQGSLEVPSGKMYNLPLLLDLLKLLGLQTPDRTAFEEARASFSIKGPRVSVRQLDLFGNAISLSGSGEMNLDGSDLQLDFYAVWGRIMQMLPALLKPLPPALAQQLLKIKVRGTVEKPEFHKEPVPVLVEPLERLLKRGNPGDAAKKPATPPAAQTP